jgi:hypothetical protein
MQIQELRNEGVNQRRIWKENSYAYTYLQISVIRTLRVVWGYGHTVFRYI